MLMINARHKMCGFFHLNELLHAFQDNTVILTVKLCNLEEEQSLKCIMLYTFKWISEEQLKK